MPNSKTRKFLLGVAIAAGMGFGSGLAIQPLRMHISPVPLLADTIPPPPGCDKPDAQCGGGGNCSEDDPPFPNGCAFVASQCTPCGG